MLEEEGAECWRDYILTMSRLDHKTSSALFSKLPGWKPNAGRDYISCHDKTSLSFLCRLLDFWLANAGGSTWYASKR